MGTPPLSIMSSTTLRDPPGLNSIFIIGPILNLCQIISFVYHLYNFSLISVKLWTYSKTFKSQNMAIYISVQILKLINLAL